MYSNYIVKDLLNNRPKTDFKYFSSLNNYRLAKIIYTTSFRKSLINANKMHTYEQIQLNIHN